MKFKVTRDEYAGVTRFIGEVPDCDLMRLRRDPLARAQLSTPPRSASDCLLVLETLFRKHEEQQAQPGGSDNG